MSLFLVIAVVVVAVLDASLGALKLSNAAHDDFMRDLFEEIDSKIRVGRENDRRWHDRIVNRGFGRYQPECGNFVWNTQQEVAANFIASVGENKDAEE